MSADAVYEEQVKPRRGCCFYGCVTSLILGLLVVVGGYLGVRWFVNQQIVKYTDTQPMELPQVQIDEAEATAVRQRVDAFAKALEEGRPAEPLVLDGRQLNLLLAASKEWAPLRDHVYLDIEGDRIQGAVSLPLENIPHPWLQKHKGRYLNGSIELRVSLTNGVLVATIESLSVKGRKVPDAVLAELRKQNLARDFYASQEGVQLVQKLEAIRVEDGRLTIVPRQRP